jgi:hypothetical protein
MKDEDMIEECLYNEYFNKNDKIIMENVQVNGLYWKKLLDLGGLSSPTKDELDWTLSCLLQDLLIKPISTSIIGSIEDSKTLFVIPKVELSKDLLDKAMMTIKTSDPQAIVDIAISYNIVSWETANGEIANYDSLINLT